MTSSRDGNGAAHLMIMGMREVLDDYAANRHRRTDRTYINGWMISCLVYDQLLTDFAAAHQVAVPVRQHGRAWSDDNRTRAEQALAAAGRTVRPAGPKDVARNA